MDAEDSGGKDKDSKKEEDEDKEMEMDDSSIPSGFLDEGEYDESSTIFEVNWGSSLSQMGESADWVPTMKSHCADIDLLGLILNSSTHHVCQGS